MSRWLLLFALVMSIGCAAKKVETKGKTMTVVMRDTINELEKEPVPGTVNDVWIEPMYDSVCYPAQLDPAQKYFRMQHCTVVEVRHKKIQKQEFPDDNGKYRVPGRSW